MLEIPKLNPLTLLTLETYAKINKNFNSDPVLPKKFTKFLLSVLRTVVEGGRTLCCTGHLCHTCAPIPSRSLHRCHQTPVAKNRLKTKYKFLDGQDLTQDKIVIFSHMVVTICFTPVIYTAK